MISIEILKLKLKKTLSRKRFEHVLSVAKLAQQLGLRWGWDPDLAYRAGLLHDAVKEWSPKKLIGYVRKQKLRVPDLLFIERVNPNLAHGYAGAYWASKNNWLHDPAALRAIANHTLGRIRMSKPEIILYVADFSSPDRSYKSAEEIRHLAFKDLRAAFRMVAAKKIQRNLKTNKPVHPQAVRVWNWINS